MVVWCARIEPKTEKVWKTSEMTRKTSKNDGFLTLFWSFLVFDPILVHQTTKFELNGQFCFSRYPLGSGGVKVVELFVFENISAVFWMLAPPGEKICFLQIEAWYNLYYFTCIITDIITFHSHNSIIFKEIYSLKLWLWHIST